MKNEIIVGDCLDKLKELPDGSVHCCITSPPFWGLRDYQMGEQLGLEETPEEYVENMVRVFREVHRVLRDDGTLWLNLGDSYAGNCSRASDNGRAGYGNKREGVFTKGGEGLKTKDLVGIPWRVAFALQADGWYLRQDIIWHKPNPMPESVTDRCTKAHEYIFLFSKKVKYYFDNVAIRETASYAGAQRGGSTNRYEQNNFGGDNKKYDTKNKRSVWSVNVKPFVGAHFATFPTDLIKPCILAGCPKGGVVLDPFAGAGTSGLVAKRCGCGFVGVELNPEYAEMARTRIENEQTSLFV